MELHQRRYRPAYCWRLLRRPGRAGQRRYLLFVRYGGSAKSDPGYLSAFAQILRHRSSRDLIVIEEIALPLPSGKLAWLSDDDIKASLPFFGPSDLFRARKVIRSINRKPLGASISRQVESSGLLEISRRNRYFARFSSLAVDESYSHGVKFDVSKKDQASKAIDYYRQLEDEIAENEKEDIKRAVERARTSDDAAKRELFASAAVKEKVSYAKQFSRALGKGQFDQIEENIGRRERRRQKKIAEEQRQKSQLTSKRTQQTIQSLTAKK